MSDTPSYRLRNADIANLDLSEFSKDYSAEELSAVRQALFQKQKEQQEKFNALPMLDQAKIYVSENFGDLQKAVEQNPEYLLAPLAAKATYDMAKPMVTRAVDTAKGIYARMIGQPKAEVPVDTFTPDKVTTPEQAVQQQVEQGKIKTGKAGGSISAEGAQTLANVSKGQAIEQTKEAIKGVVEPNNPAFKDAEKLKTGTNKTAYAGAGPEGKLKSSYASVKDLPTGLAFVPGAQYADVHRQDLGQTLYTEQFKNRPFSQTYIGNPAAAVEVNREINRAAGRLTREELIAQGVPKEQIGKPTEGIFERIGNSPKASKAIKIGGVIGAATAIPNLANAQSLTEAGLRAADIATDYIPIVGQIKQGLTPSEAGAPVVPPSRFSEAAKLGSPYYNTEWAKKERSKAVPPPR